MGALNENMLQNKQDFCLHGIVVGRSEDNITLCSV
jgi:hypothetical protein